MESLPKFERRPLILRQFLFQERLALESNRIDKNLTGPQVDWKFSSHGQKASSVEYTKLGFPNLKTITVRELYVVVYLGALNAYIRSPAAISEEF